MSGNGEKGTPPEWRMDEAVRALALEVPDAIHADIWRRWTDVVDVIYALRADNAALRQSLQGLVDLADALDARRAPASGRSDPA